jgi:hypothetical protein
MSIQLKAHIYIVIYHLFTFLSILFSLGEITIAMIQIDHIQMKLDKGPGTCIRPILEAHLDQNVKTDTAYLTTDQPPTLPGVLLKVDGMTCFPCSSSVETQFKKLKGIHFVSVALMASC